MGDHLHDAAAFIGLQVKNLMQQIADIDPYQPDEDQVEVLIGSFKAWGILEAQLLFPALETAMPDTEAVVAAGQDRLNTLQSLEEGIHIGEGGEGPFAALVDEYIKAIKYHLLVDVQEFVPLAQWLSIADNQRLAEDMAAMRLELE